MAFTIIRQMRREFCVYWKYLETDEYQRKVYAPPVQLKCRWDEKHTQFIDPKGRTLVSRAVVYPEISVVPGDLLMRGKLTSPPPLQPKGPTDGVFEVRGKNDIRRLRNPQELHIAYL